jgi:predicted GIY-YIG superfamily endonuclease
MYEKNTDPLPVIVYGLSSTEDGEVRYIGQTTHPSKRLNNHISRSKTGNTHKKRWIRSVIAKGFEVQMVVLLEDAVWDEDEIRIIEEHKAAGARLTNATDGGGGMKNATPETRAKMSAATRARPPISDETRANMSAAQRAKAPVSDETRAKLSAAARNISDEHRAKLSAAGRNRSDETRAKLSAAGRARAPFSDEHRAKMSAAQRAKAPFSDEHRAKMSAAARARHAKRKSGFQLTLFGGM